MGDVGWKEVDKMVLFYKGNREKVMGFWYLIRRSVALF